MKNTGHFSNIRIFITGKPGTGKTTLVMKLSSYLQEKGINITGFYTEEMRERGKRMGFKLTTLPDGQISILASTKPAGIPFGRYYVKTDGIDKGIQAIKKDADIIILDEVGPMEMKHTDFMPVVKKILGSGKNVIAVIHRNWINMVEEENLYEITIENRHDLHKELKEIVSRYISDSN